MIQYGLLKIRAYGWAERPELCAIEADHLHNLPDVIADYSDDRLAYYLDVERPAYLSYIKDCGGQSLLETIEAWEPYWERIEAYLAADQP